MRTLLLLLCCLACAIIAPGCAARLPIYPTMSDNDALAVLRIRSAAIKRVQADCELELIDAQGERVRLDCAMVLDFPNKARIRAWKLGHAVFDLTLTAPAEPAESAARLAGPTPAHPAPERTPSAAPLGMDAEHDEHDGSDASGSVYLFIMREQDPRSQAAGSHVAASMRTVIGLLDPALMRRATVDTSRSTPQTLVLVIRTDAPASSAVPAERRREVEVVCEVDRPTLVPRRFRIGDDLEMSYERVVEVPGGVWPARIALRSPSGTIIIQTADDIGINPTLDSRTFTPPARARKLP